MYRLTDNTGHAHYHEGTAEEILSVMIRNSVRFIDTDGSTLKVILL